MGKHSPTVRIAAEVAGWDRLRYEANVCPNCVEVIYVEQVDCGQVAEMTPVAEAVCPRCGVGILLARITTPRLVCLGLEDRVK